MNLNDLKGRTIVNYELTYGVPPKKSAWTEGAVKVVGITLILDDGQEITFVPVGHEVAGLDIYNELV